MAFETYLAWQEVGDRVQLCSHILRAEDFALRKADAGLNYI